MTKKACMSNCKDPENRSKKDCVCGAHSHKARKKRKVSREKVSFQMIKDQFLKDTEQIPEE